LVAHILAALAAASSLVDLAIASSLADLVATSYSLVVDNLVGFAVASFVVGLRILVVVASSMVVHHIPYFVIDPHTLVDHC